MLSNYIKTILVITLVDIFRNTVFSYNSSNEEEGKEVAPIYGNNHRLEILYCSGWGYKNTFDEYQKKIYREYSNIDVKGRLYPLSTSSQILKYIVYLLQILVIYIGFCNEHAKKLLSFLPVSILEYIRGQSKGSIIIMVLVLNGLGGVISSSGAFEVYLNGKLIFSKIETGKIVEYSSLISSITNYVVLDRN